MSDEHPIERITVVPLHLLHRCCVREADGRATTPAPSKVDTNPSGACSLPTDRLMATSHTTAALSST